MTTTHQCIVIAHTVAVAHPQTGRIAGVSADQASYSGAYRFGADNARIVAVLNEYIFTIEVAHDGTDIGRCIDCGLGIAVCDHTVIAHGAKQSSRALTAYDHTAFQTQILHRSGIDGAKETGITIFPLGGSQVIDPMSPAVKSTTELVGRCLIGTADGSPSLPFQINIRLHFQSIPTKVFPITNHVGNQTEIVRGTDLVYTVHFGQGSLSPCIFPCQDGIQAVLDKIVLSVSGAQCRNTATQILQGDLCTVCNDQIGRTCGKGCGVQGIAVADLRRGYGGIDGANDATCNGFSVIAIFNQCIFRIAGKIAYDTANSVVTGNRACVIAVPHLTARRCDHAHNTADSGSGGHCSTVITANDLGVIPSGANNCTDFIGANDSTAFHAHVLDGCGRGETEEPHIEITGSNIHVVNSVAIAVKVSCKSGFRLSLCADVTADGHPLFMGKVNIPTEFHRFIIKGLFVHIDHIGKGTQFLGSMDLIDSLCVGCQGGKLFSRVYRADQDGISTVFGEVIVCCKAISQGGIGRFQIGFGQLGTTRQCATGGVIHKCRTGQAVTVDKLDIGTGSIYRQSTHSRAGNTATVIAVTDHRIRGTCRQPAH